MNGGRKMKIYNSIILLIVLLDMTTSVSKEAVIPVTLKIDDAIAYHRVGLEVLQKGKRISYLSSDEKGNITLPLRGITPGADVIIIPGSDNGISLLRPNRKFLMGFTRVSTRSESAKVLDLESRQTIPKAIRFIDPNGEPIAKTNVHWKAEIPMGSNPRDPIWEYQWTIKTDPNGVVTLYALDEGIGKYEASVRSYNDQGDIYWGDMNISGEKLVVFNARKPYVIKVGIKKLSLKVRAIWDPAYSIEPFHKNKKSMTLTLTNGSGLDSATIGNDGYARFYTIKPDKYTLIPGGQGSGFRQTYRITGGTEKLEIPKDETALPVEHTITLLPREKWELKGVVLDKKTGKTVENALVEYDGPMTKFPKTNGDGAFSLPIVEGLGKKLIVRHNDYSPGQFTLPVEEPSKVTTYLLEPLPILRGTVTTGTDKKPAALATLWLHRPNGRDFRTRCNQQGEYSLPVESGKYGLHIDKIMTAPVQKSTSTMPLRAALYRELFTMPKADTTKNFHLGGIAKITINVTQNEESARIGLPKGICLLRENDTIMTGGAFTDASLMTIYVIEGKYKMLIIDESEKLGALVGSVDATADKENNIEARITAWRKIGHQTVGGYLDTLKMILGEPVTKKP